MFNYEGKGSCGQHQFLRYHYKEQSDPSVRLFFMIIKINDETISIYICPHDIDIKGIFASSSSGQSFMINWDNQLG